MHFFSYILSFFNSSPTSNALLLEQSRAHLLRRRFSSKTLPPTDRPGSLLYHVHTGDQSEKRPCIFNVDKQRRLVGFLARECSGSSQLTVLLDGIPCTPVFSRRITEPSNEDHIEQFFHLFWISIPREDGTLSLQDEHGPIPFLWNDEPVASLAVSACFARHTTSPRTLFSKFRKILAYLPPVFTKYSNCWLLVDRDFRADDNAEHLYRWIMLNRPEQKIFFGLRTDSPDWSRLEKDGFRLLPIGSLQYFFAWLHADWLLSSNATGYIRRYDWQRSYADCVRHKFCFLQHGITHNYQPSFNLHPADALIAATANEREAFVDDQRFAYVFTNREIQLTGFPRHDPLLKKAAGCAKPRVILVAPTWRQNLTAGFIPGTGQYPYSETFRQSSYFQCWQDVLQNKTLHAAAERHGYSILFFPHAYMRQQLSDFDLSRVTVPADAGSSIQDLLANTALFITDYSSTAMEAAFIRRAILYFQFDRDAFFAEHSYTRGYFDYDRDGFGDVVLSVTDLVEKSVALLDSDCAMNGVYAERADAFFTFNDQNNCQRVYDAICDSSVP